MLKMEEYLAEAYTVWTHKETADKAAPKHLADLEKGGHRIMGHSSHTDMHGGKIHRILSKDPNGTDWVHSIGDVSEFERKDKRFHDANSWRVMKRATASDRKTLKGKKPQ